jgi:hypothetical protein
VCAQVIADDVDRLLLGEAGKQLFQKRYELCTGVTGSGAADYGSAIVAGPYVAFVKSKRIMSANIKSLIAPRLRKRKDIPRSLKALTIPIDVEKEADIVRSIWDTLQGIDFFVTLEGRLLVFYRRLASPASEGARGRARQVVKTR